MQFSATLLADVAKAVLGVIAHTEETKNRVVYVHSALLTQNQLIHYAKDKNDKDWDIVVKETEAVRKKKLCGVREGGASGYGESDVGVLHSCDV